ncbi:hypothetical protein P7C70_g5598, partial [Phenoliferia sp. Uapishka_3]
MQSGSDKPTQCDPPTLTLATLAFDDELTLRSWTTPAELAFSWTSLSYALRLDDLFHFPIDPISSSSLLDQMRDLAKACRDPDNVWAVKPCVVNVLTQAPTSKPALPYPGNPLSTPRPTSLQPPVLQHSAIVQMSREGFTISLLRPCPDKSRLRSATSRSSTSTKRPSLLQAGNSGSSEGTLPRSADSVETTDSNASDYSEEKSKKKRSLTEYLSESGRRPELDQARLQRMIDQMAQICFSLEPNGDATFFNKQWYDYTGLPQNATPIDANVFHPDEHADIASRWAASIATGAPYNMQYRLRGADGSWRSFLAQARKVVDKNGAIEAWVGVLTDVEELVRVRSDAQQLQSHVKAVLTTAGLILLSIDKNSVITLWEGSAESVSASQIGLKLSDVWPEASLHDAIKTMFDTDEDSHVVEIDSTDEGGQRVFLRFRLVPLRTDIEEVSGIIIVASNITTQIVAEEALKQAEEERSRLISSETAAKEASRLKTEFITTVSHELRDLRKIEAGQIELEIGRFSARDLLIEAVQGFKSTALKQKITVDLDVEEGFSSEDLVGDHGRFRQIFMNGLSNGVKFSHAGGHLSVRLRQEGETNESVAMRVEIQDEGVGIADDVLRKLFQPFKQAETSTSRRYGGSGLGLVISRQLAELLGGTVDLESTLGVGTTMIVRIAFPKFVEEVAPPRVTSPMCAPLSETSLPRTRKKSENIVILVAEDNDLLREIVTRTLLKRGFQVDGVRDGVEAVAAVHMRQYDLV